MPYKPCPSLQEDLLVLHNRHFLTFFYSRKSFWLNKDNKLVSVLQFSQLVEMKKSIKDQGLWSVGVFLFRKLHR